MKKNVASKSARGPSKSTREQVYLSYVMSDREMARQIAETIREAGFKVWDPLEDVSMGDNSAIEIGKALAGSAAMVLLVSPDAVRSGNFNLELGFALEAEQFANRVIPVLVKETPDAPWILKKFQYVPWGPRAAEAIVQRLEGMHDAKA